MLLITPLSVRAVVISSGTGNTGAPADDPGFANVGTLNGASVIYLGNQWVLTAAHVAGSLPASVNFGGTNYTTELGSWQRLTNNGTGGMSALTDMVVFRLALDPGLSALTISSTSLSSGNELIMIGNGRDRQAGTTYWNSSWTEVTPPPPATYTGFKTNATKTVRWGQNKVAVSGTNINAGFGDVRSLTTTFTQNGGALTHEAQAVNGDSGGAVFYKNGSSWELSGMMVAIATLSGQPADTAVYGDVTYSADLSFYRSQIVSITSVPEPSSLVLLLFSSVALLAQRRPRFL